jgi:hypothetical protein
MRKILFLFACLCGLLSNGQDSLTRKNIKAFCTYNLSAGMIYAHSIGGGIKIKNRHEIGAEMIAFVPGSPFKEKWTYGAYLNYRYFPFKTRQTINCFITGEVAWDMYSYSDFSYISPNQKSKVTANEIYCFAGIGSQVKLYKNLSLQAVLDFYLFEDDINHTYYRNDWKTTDNYLNINEFWRYKTHWTGFLPRVGDVISQTVLLKTGLKYTF